MVFIWLLLQKQYSLYYHEYCFLLGFNNYCIRFYLSHTSTDARVALLSYSYGEKSYWEVRCWSPAVSLGTGRGFMSRVADTSLLYLLSLDIELLKERLQNE